jgi:hypothetical protein
MNTGQTLNNNNSTKEQIQMRRLINKLKSIFLNIKCRVQSALKTEDLDLYEFEQLDAKRSYRPLRNPWEQL